MMTPVYMDYHATTPVDPEVVTAMLPYFSEQFGNPASRQHRFGWIADEAVESARKSIAGFIGADSREIIFTSGATESNNLAIKGVAESLKQKGDHIITVSTEHKSVIDTCHRLEKYGFHVTYLSVDEFGTIDLNQLREQITPKTILVSVMIANNEIGTIQDAVSIGSICKEHGILFHTDASQAIGKIPIHVGTMHIDLMSFTGHKIYGPKGIGVLYVRQSDPRVKLTGQMDGGGHERGMRSGTLNVPSIVGFAKALEIARNVMPEESKRISGLRDTMFSAFLSQLGDVVLNGHPKNRLPNNLNVSFPHVEDSVLMMTMKDIAVSTGSACSTSNPDPSHVLKALKYSNDRIHSAIRFGLGRFTTQEEVDYTIRRVIETVNQLRQSASSYSKNQISVPEQSI